MDSYKGRRDNKKRERQLEVEETMGRERETESGEKRQNQIRKSLIKKRRKLPAPPDNMSYCSQQKATFFILLLFSTIK